MSGPWLPDPGGIDDPLHNAEGWSLLEARQYLARALGEGATCPCCGQHAQRYRRSLNSGMARALVTLYQAQRVGTDAASSFIDFGALLVLKGQKPGDYAKLRWWKLIEERERYPDLDGLTTREPKTGYRITAMGRAFVEGRCRVRSHANVYNGRPLYADGDLVGIRDCLGDRFDLDELLGRKKQ